MRILALDPSSKLGWAVVDSGSVVDFGTLVFTGDRAKKLLELHTALGYLTGQDGEMDVIVFERPFARGQAATRMLWGMAGIIEAFAFSRGLPTVDLDPQTLKKWATGSGKADKEKMMDAARSLGEVPATDHEADAILLGLYAADNIEVV